MEEGLALFTTRSTTPMPDQWALVEAEAGALLEVEDGGRCGHRSRWTPRVEVEVLLEVEAEDGGQCDAQIQGAT